MRSYSEAGFEAVEGCPVVVVLVPALAEEEGVLIEEEVSLHGFEPGQLLHSHRRPFVADPHSEAPLHHHTAQLAELSLTPQQKKKKIEVFNYNQQESYCYNHYT